MTRRQPSLLLYSSLAALVALAALSLPVAWADDTKPKPAAAIPAVLDKPAPETVADLKAMEQEVKKVLEKVIPCTVNIRDGSGQGSGVIVSDDGYVLTAGHVSREANRDVQVTLPDGRRVKAKTLGANHYIDSGFLKITDPAPAPGKWPHAELGKSADLKKGQWVITTGHPGGWKEGRSPVVRLGRILQATDFLIRTDCTIVGGDSGGPLFDMNGKVIGIHSRIANSLASNIHVPADTYRATWDRLVKGDVWGNGFMGFQADRKAKGCRIEEVRKDSPAEKGGLKADDVILKFDGKKIESFDQFGERLREATIGSVVPIEVERGEEIVTLKVTIGKRDVNLPAGPMEMTKEELTKNGTKVLNAFRDAAGKARQSTVKVLCDGKDAALGTVVGPDGWVLTKFSELKGRTTCKLPDGRDLEAQVVGTHEAFDLALLKIDARGLAAVEWQESKVAPVGNWVVSAGLAADPVAIGVVSVGVRKGNPKEARPARDPANSGYLGITLAPIEGGGVKIDQVMPDTAAAKAGLKPNDTVLLLEGKTVKDVEEFIANVGGHKPGDIVTLKIKRGSEEKEIKATLGKRPPDRGDIQNAMGGTLSPRRAGFPAFLQHDTVLKPQDCGGPVVDLDGRVIGINIARAGRTESYAIPSEALQPLLFDLMSGKLAPKATTTAATTAAEKVAVAKAALQKAEAEKATTEKKLIELKAALEKAEADLKREKEKETKASK